MSKKHVVGNCYALLGHLLELTTIVGGFARNRYTLSCRVMGQGGKRKCCTRDSGIEMTCHLDDLDKMELVHGATVALSIEPEEWQKGDIAEVSKDWDRAGVRFDVLGPAVYSIIFQQQWWVPVNDPEDEDPTWHKAASLKRVLK